MPVWIESVRQRITLHFFESPLAASRPAVFLQRCIVVRGRVHTRGRGSVARSTEAAHSWYLLRCADWAHSQSVTRNPAGVRGQRGHRKIQERQKMSRKWG